MRFFRRFVDILRSMSNWDDIDANELRAAGDGNNTPLQDERDGDDQVTVAYSPVSFQDAIMEEEVETSDAPEVPSAPIVVNDPGTTHPTDIEPTASAVSVSSVMNGSAVPYHVERCSRDAIRGARAGKSRTLVTAMG